MTRRSGRRTKTGANLVLPGPRRSSLRHRRMRIIWIILAALLIAIGWLGYRTLSSTTRDSVEFSGP